MYQILDEVVLKGLDLFRERFLNIYRKSGLKEKRSKISVIISVR